MSVCLICSSPLVTCQFCMGDGCDSCAGGQACTQCAGPEQLRGSGWSSQTVRVAIRPYRDEIRDVLDELLGSHEWGFHRAKSGKINREAYLDGWHLGIEESLDSEGKTVFKGLAEHEGKNVACRLPVAWVDEIRSRVCPDAKGTSL